MLKEGSHLEQAVLQVLTGVSVQDVEKKYSVDRNSLLTGVEVYRAAGLLGLDRIATNARWHYWRIPLATTVHTHFSVLEDELLASNIGPLCTQLTNAGYISRWWFMRKADQGPHLRLRIFGQEPALSQEGIPRVEERLARMEADKRIRHWATLLYEPETMLFGGPEAIEFAHGLFHKDSSALCQWLDVERREIEPRIASRQKLRPEASLFVVQQLLRGAGLDAFEQWDVWTQVTKLRPGATTVSARQRQKNVAALNSLLIAPQAQLPKIFGDPLYAVLAGWAESFAEAGRTLAQLNRDGALQRGLRQILATHIIFHWNRFNFGAARQVELATMAEIRARC